MTRDRPATAVAPFGGRETPSGRNSRLVGLLRLLRLLRLLSCCCLLEQPPLLWRQQRERVLGDAIAVSKLDACGLGGAQFPRQPDSCLPTPDVSGHRRSVERDDVP